MKTTILVYVIALGGVAMIAFWALGALHSDQGKGRSEALHTDDPNNSCRSCPDWPCPGLAPVARVGGLPVNDLRLAMSLYWLCYRHNNQNLSRPRAWSFAHSCYACCAHWIR